ncbi:MAG: pantoate--beta-alanine ligase [Pseudomonadota bacterium]
MKVHRTLASLRDALRRRERPLALVPTMGNLHAGHLSLVDAARQEAGTVVASIFVNPTQFGPGEDFEAYPRTEEKDLEQLKAHKCDLVFAPAAREMYPRGLGDYTEVLVPPVGQGLCDASRPSHFAGVTSVVARLLNAVTPDVAFFGEKDYQQLLTIQRMVQDLLWPVKIKAVPIAREATGLAMSSRNNYLTEAEKQHAPLLNQTLKDLAAALANVGAAPPQLLGAARERLRQGGFEPEYLELRRQADLAPAAPEDQRVILLAAARLGRTRLIDNRVFTRENGVADP